jgi:broad specificity phosphatase PhoE
VKLHLVRHGEASAGWDADPDPGLSPLGVEQAAAVVARLAPLGPLPVFVSPLRRTRETAAPLTAVWGVEPTVEPRVAEIVSPTDDLAARTEWLRGVMATTWTAVADLASWRDDVVGALLAIESDAVVVTHFVAINVAVGRATDDDRVLCSMPGNGSVTTFESDGSTLRLVELGESVSAPVVR